MVSREEFTTAIDRQNEYLGSILDRGFDGLNRRMDIANGRTSKLEDRVANAERSVAVLLDRATQAEAKAVTAKQEAGNSKWWASGVAAFAIAVIEIVKRYFAGQ